ncbi:MAG: rod shape-determining protein MreD [Candidatus Entotheonellia bacterium]
MFPATLLFVVMLNQIYAPLSRLPGGLEPDMALLVAVSGGLVYTPGGAAVLGFTAGLLQETLAGGLLGVGALSKGLTGLLWTRLWRQVISDAPLLQLPLLAGLTVFDGAVFFCTSMLFSTPTPSWDTFFPLLWRQLLSNILLGPFVLMLFAVIHRRLKRPKRSSRRRHESAITFQPD